MVSVSLLVAFLVVVVSLESESCGVREVVCWALDWGLRVMSTFVVKQAAGKWHRAGPTNDSGLEIRGAMLQGLDERQCHHLPISTE